MEENKTGTFEESPGRKSWMRFACTVALIQALVTSWFIIIKGDPSGNGMYLTIFWALLAFCPKFVQKFAEAWANKKA